MLCVRSLETCTVCCHKHNWLTSYIYIEVSCDMKVFVYSPELKLDGKINQANSAMFLRFDRFFLIQWCTSSEKQRMQ